MKAQFGKSNVIPDYGEENYPRTAMTNAIPGGAGANNQSAFGLNNSYQQGFATQNLLGES